MCMIVPSSLRPVAINNITSCLLDGDATVGAHLALEAGPLAGGELAHAAAKITHVSAYCTQSQAASY